MIYRVYHFDERGNAHFVGMYNLRMAKECVRTLLLKHEVVGILANTGKIKKFRRYDNHVY